MPFLKIRVLECSTEEKLLSTITLPLNLVGIIAKHLPDQIIRIIYDKNDPLSGSVALNLRTVAQTINAVLCELEAGRRKGEVKGVIAEIELASTQVKDLQEKANLSKVVFSVEDS
ncbi:hypothetical protein TFLX_02458 [Thermoflexales bacterium]|nr:hypothetical protein TFLX_02458 [Thermoflexales bacterium]